MNDRLARFLDDHYYTVCWVACGAVCTVLSLWIGGPR